MASKWVVCPRCEGEGYVSKIGTFTVDDLDHLYGDDWEERERFVAEYTKRGGAYRLTPDQRQVIMLLFSEGWENEAVAAALGRPVGAVKALQHRALSALRRMLLKSSLGWEDKNAFEYVT